MVKNSLVPPHLSRFAVYAREAEEARARLEAERARAEAEAQARAEVEAQQREAERRELRRMQKRFAARFEGSVDVTRLPPVRAAHAHRWPLQPTLAVCQPLTLAPARHRHMMLLCQHLLKLTCQSNQDKSSMYYQQTYTRVNDTRTYLNTPMHAFVRAHICT